MSVKDDLHGQGSVPAANHSIYPVLKVGSRVVLLLAVLQIRAHFFLSGFENSDLDPTLIFLINFDLILPDLNIVT